MKDYLRYNSIEFAQDDTFLKWVKYPEEYPEVATFWENWIAQHPEKKEEVLEARDLILALVEEHAHPVDDLKEQDLWARLNQSLDERPISVQKRNKPVWVYALAASLFLAVTASTLFWWPQAEKLESIHSSAELNFIKEISNDDRPKTIVLGDGSTILLQPKSSLQYPEVFGKELRTVKLTGEAFFEVARDAQKPFQVHAGELITKVLGTSFTIRAFQDEDQVLVQVKTGKVSVFEESSEPVKSSSGNHSKGVFLTPNQQVTFLKRQSQLVKTLVENPSLLNVTNEKIFEFKDTPLNDVFSVLEKAYGVEIIFDKELMGACALNASLEGMPLYDKMRLICKGVNAQYEILDARIIVSGKGCK
jgi:ferric-dicitrate binding protein FerR (iron transport regulator)